MNVALRPLAALLATIALLESGFANVIVVSPAGGNFTQIQAAVTAAADGDTILVKAGSYSGFTVTNKALDIVAEVGATVSVAGQVRVKQLGATRTLTLTGLRIHATTNAPALLLENDAGSVRAQSCVIDGLDGALCQNFSHGAIAATITSCPDVALCSCTVNGGDGGDYGGYGYGGDGGKGLVATGSRVALYDCTVRGGRGASWVSTCGSSGYGYAGSGMNAAELVSCPTGFLSNCTVLGGDSGCDIFLPITCSTGAGLMLGPGTAAQALSSAFRPGFFCGSCVPACFSCSQGVLVNGGAFTTLIGVAAHLSASRVVREQGACRLDLFGQPGSRVEIRFSEDARFSYSPAAHGVSLLRLHPPVPVLQAGTLDANGTLNVSWIVPDLDPGVQSRRLFVQATFVDPGGQRTLSSPATIVLLDSAY